MQTYSLDDILAGRAPYQRAVSSPDHRYVLVLLANEAFNSQWVEVGTIHRAADGAVLAQIGEWNWHVDKHEWAADSVTVWLRRWPGDAPGVVLDLDLAADTARPSDGSAETIQLPGLTDWLETWYIAHRGQKR